MNMTTTALNLPEIAQEITLKHGLAVESAKNAVDYARQAGDLLNKAKSLVEHGQWTPWLQDNCGISQRTAQGYMRLSRLLLDNPQKAQRVADLPLRQAIKQLAKPRQDNKPDDAKDYRCWRPEDIGKSIPWLVMADVRMRNIANNIKMVEPLLDERLYSGQEMSDKNHRTLQTLLCTGLHYTAELLETLSLYDGSNAKAFRASMAMYRCESEWFNGIPGLKEIYREMVAGGMFREIAEFMHCYAMSKES